MFKAYGRWLPYITDIFLPICDSERGDYIAFPFPGSYMDQPYMTMQILNIVQSAYRQVLSARAEKIKAESMGKARKRR